MKFMNSNYGNNGYNYANFARVSAGDAARKVAKERKAIERGLEMKKSGQIATPGASYNSKNPAMGRGDFAPSVFPNEVGPQPLYGPRAQSKALKDTFARPQIREPGVERNARSTAAGVNQRARDTFKTQGRTGKKVKSAIAGARQSGRDAIYAGKRGLKAAGRFAMKNKLGVGLAAAGALGAVGYGVYRKTRSDKGRKRGSYD